MNEPQENLARPPRRRWPVVLAFVAGLVVLGAAAFFAFAWRAAIDPVAPPARNAFAADALRHGEQLAALGNCIGCHTAPGGGLPFAGGTPVVTPFGTIHGSNITPDAETGIGNWSEAAFRRALREGVSRDGHLLYPAFPYDHFTRLQDGDIGALYAFVMTREPVHAYPPANRLMFPLQFRPLVAGWNLLFLDVGPVPARTSQGAEWNRGAYLANSVAHCAACHSPRNALGAENKARAFAGGEAEGWHATALNAESPSPLPWSVEALATYLRTGLAADHAIAAGPMQDVAHSLSHASEADVHAIAVYVQSLMGGSSPERETRAAGARQRAAQPLAATAPNAGDDAKLQLGARVYADNCASCHDAGRAVSSAGALPMPLAIALYLPDARNLLHIVREGIQPVAGTPGRWMPAFAGALSEEQIGALAAWLRREAAGAPPWADLAQAVQDTRKPQP